MASQLTDCVRHLRSRAQALEQVNLNTVGGEDVRRDLSELAAVVTAIVANNHLDLIQISELLFQVVRQALCRRADRVDIHAVRTDTHDTAQSARTEFQILIEAFDQFCGIFAIEQCLYLSACFSVITFRKPSLGLISDHFEQFVVFHVFLILCLLLLIQ